MTIETWRVRSSGRLVFALAALAALLAGCGSGTAGLLSGGDDGGGPSATLAACTIPRYKVSPARIELTAAGPTGSELVVELLYSLPGTELRPMTALAGPGVSDNQVTLPASKPGTPTHVEWDFAADLGDARYEPEVRLVARPPGGAIPTTGDLTLGIGNDVPVLEEVLVPDEEISGNVPIDLRVSDSSSDVVTLLVEWRRADAPLDPWQPATAAGLFPQGIETRPADQGGVELTFFWNTGVDLDDLEHDVLVRVTPDDRTLDSAGQPAGIGEPREGAPFRVDNNEEPIVTIESGSLVSNPDQRRGIPVPFRVIDEERDEVQVVFQWRRAGETFPQLPADASQLEPLLADPDERRARRICTEFPTFVEGRIVALPGAPDAVRLPELASEAAGILARGIEGRALELLRPTRALEPVVWSQNPLAGPVAAVPLGDGLTALVLDAAGGWRLREVALANGRVVRTIAAGSAMPSALALEAGGEHAALVASDLGIAWRIERVELATGAVTQLFQSDPGEIGPVRAIASLGTRACVFTVGSTFTHLDYRAPDAALAGTILAGLSTPSGLAVDPLHVNRVYLAERDAPIAGGIGRILAVDLDRRGPVPTVIAAPVVPALGLERPEGLALEQNGSRLLALCAAGTAHQLVRVDLGAEGANALRLLGPALDGGATGLVTGPDDLRLAVLSSSDGLALSGGVEQRRTILEYEPGSQSVQLGAPLDPPARNLTPWRIPAGMPVRPGPGGSRGDFVWDSADVPGGGPVLLRALPYDGERGTGSDAANSKAVLDGYEVSQALANVSAPVLAADLDGDGDLDLVSTSPSTELKISWQVAPREFGAVLVVDRSTDPIAVVADDMDGDGDLDLAWVSRRTHDVRISFQVSPGTFDPHFVRLGGIPAPTSLAAADLDGDRDLDLVAGSEDADSLFLFFQDAPGHFAGDPVRIGDSTVTADPTCVVAGDLDGDGDLDLAVATARANDLAVFFQGSPGSFGAPLILGDSAGDGTLSVAAADLDGDGDLDLAVANGYASRALKVYFQESPGSFGPDPLVLGDFAPTGTPQSVTTGDVDGDGDLDLVAIARNRKDMAVFFQEAPGSFGSDPLVLPGVFTTEPVAVLAADLDGNGDLDLLAPGGGLTVAYGESRGRLATVPLTMGLADSRALLGSADLDGDGSLDLVSSSDPSKLEVFFQSAPGSFSEAPLEVGDATTISQAVAVAAADLDGDGDIDLATANLSSHNVTVFFQTVPRTFDPVPLVLGAPGTTDNPRGLAAGDVDGDGDIDLVVSTGLDNDLVIFLQTGPRAFALGPRLDVGVEIYGGMVGTGDLGGDGDLDLVTSRKRGSITDIVVFLNAPGGLDSPPLVIEDGGNRFELIDIDGDGDLDLMSWLAGFVSSRTVKIFFQVEPDAFAVEPLVVGTLAFLNSIDSAATADLDADGDLDLAVCDHSGSRLAIFFQDAPGSFDPRPFLLANADTVFPSRLLASDLDGDGDADLSAITRAGDMERLAVFFGGR